MQSSSLLHVPYSLLLLLLLLLLCRYGSDEIVDRWMHWVSDDWDTLTPGNYEEPAPAASSSSSAAAVAASSSSGSSA
jgi:hypothetical protein